MVRPAVYASAAVVACAALAMRIQRSPAEDPAATLPDALVGLRVGQLDDCLNDLFPGTWTVQEISATGRAGRSLRLECHGPVTLHGSATAVLRHGLAVAWLWLETGSGTEGGDSERYLEALQQSLFPLAPGPEGRPLVPNPFELMRRLGVGEDAPMAVRAGGWEIPLDVAEGSAILMSTSPAFEDVTRRGFCAIGIGALGAEDRRELARFARELSKAASGLSALPTPAPPPSAKSWGNAFRSERDLQDGVTLEEGLRRAEEGRKYGLWPVVAGELTVLVAMQDGPGPSEVSAILLASQDGPLLRAILPATSPEARELRRLPMRSQGAPQPMPGNLVFSGLLGPEAWDAYAGRVYQLRNFAFEWRPIGF